MAATDRAEQPGDDLGEPGPGAYARRPHHREQQPAVLGRSVAVDPALAVGRLDGGFPGLLLRDGHPRLPPHVAGQIPCTREQWGRAARLSLSAGTVTWTSSIPGGSKVCSV